MRKLRLNLSNISSSKQGLNVQSGCQIPNASAFHFITLILTSFFSNRHFKILLIFAGKKKIHENLDAPYRSTDI